MGESGGVSQSIIALLRRRLESWREWQWWWCWGWGAGGTWQVGATDLWYGSHQCYCYCCKCLGGISVCRLAGELRAVLGDLRVSCLLRDAPMTSALACEFHMLPKTCGWAQLCQPAAAHGHGSRGIFRGVGINQGTACGAGREGSLPCRRKASSGSPRRHR